MEQLKNKILTHKHKILIVDDQAEQLETIVETIVNNTNSYRVMQAFNGRAAIKIAEKEIPDLVITDWEMPGMSGIDLIRLLKSKEKTKDIPVIMCTGVMTKSENLASSLEVGAVDYVRKPVDKIELLARINSMLMLSESYKWIKMQNHQLELQKEEIVSALAQLSLTLETLRSTQDELVESKKMNSLGGLVAGVAHEINTPVGISITAVTALHGFSNEIMNSFSKEELTKSELNQYFVSAQDTTTLIEGNLMRAARIIKSFKEIAAEQHSNEIRELRLAGAIDDIETTLTPELRRRGHSLTVTCPEDLVVKSNPGSLYSVFTNLIMNALTHAYKDAEKGNLSLDVAVVDEERIRITFSDDGRGMEAEELEEIFTPFYTTNRTGGGTGLGLSITYNIITNLGGRIWCESTPGMGSTFIIELACGVKRPSVARPTSAARPSSP